MSENEDGRAPEREDRRIKETSTGDDARRFPRYPSSGVWSAPERSAHRKQRDGIIRDAGLQPEAEPDADAEGD